jgi:hypothetical protein
MAYFAQVNSENVVTEVIAVNNETIEYLPYPESEPVGQAFIASLGLTGLFLQTSYNNNFRGTFAGIGYTYDPVQDVFVPLPSIEPIEPV